MFNTPARAMLPIIRLLFPPFFFFPHPSLSEFWYFSLSIEIETGRKYPATALPNALRRLRTQQHPGVHRTGGGHEQIRSRGHDAGEEIFLEGGEEGAQVAEEEAHAELLAVHEGLRRGSRWGAVDGEFVV